MKPAVNKATALVAGDASANAPVDKGALKASVHMEPAKGVGTNVQGRVFTNLEYAPFVEFGTGRKGQGTYPYKIKGVSLTYRQTPWMFENEDGEMIWTAGQVAQPFMYPAIKNNETQVKQILQTHFQTEVRKAIR